MVWPATARGDSVRTSKIRQRVQVEVTCSAALRRQLQLPCVVAAFGHAADELHGVALLFPSEKRAAEVGLLESQPRGLGRHRTGLHLAVEGRDLPPTLAVAA
jgi:hypothetical protein